MAKRTLKLHQILATEKGIKTRVTSEITKIYHDLQKEGLFKGSERSYKPIKDDDPEKYPDESVKVQFQVSELLKQLKATLPEYLDVVATKEVANASAKADVMLNGEVFLAGVPATFLLFLEKRLNELKAEVDKIPVLDTAHDWMIDPNSGLFRGQARSTSKTRKEPRVVSKAKATEQHPEQAEVIYQDLPIGHWTQIDLSGAMPAPEKRKIQEKLTQLTKAVKHARTEANEVEAPEQKAGEKILHFLFG